MTILESMIVLYADDDWEDLEFFAAMLKIVDPNATCIYARDGIEAIETLSNSLVVPDYIFLDINMPVMDGRTCLREIRKDHRFADVPIVIYTTSSDPKEKELCLELGAAAYLFKPTTIETGIVSLSHFFTKKA